jgi:hypothetical protein
MSARNAEYERVADDIPCPGTRVHEDWLKYLLEDGKKAVQHRDHWHVIPAAFRITGWISEVERLKRPLDQPTHSDGQVSDG